MNNKSVKRTPRQPKRRNNTGYASINTMLLRWIFSTAMMLSATANAALDDRSKPINIKADSSEYNQKTGVQTFSGNVEISQGSMSIVADSIVIEMRDGTFYKITGKGTPIQFQQLTDKQELMRGESETIVYDTASSQLTFKGGASFERPGQRLTGHSIEYNLKELTFKANSTTNGRVNIVLQPNNN